MLQKQIRSNQLARPPELAPQPRWAEFTVAEVIDQIYSRPPVHLLKRVGKRPGSQADKEMWAAWIVVEHTCATVCEKISKD